MSKLSEIVKRLSAFCLLISWSIVSLAGEGAYYFPIRPGQQNYLSGTMGELRSSHFHAGIDIKTGGVEGLKVHAAQTGYVSRIKVSPSGYGNVLYIAHPHLGTTTVYGHLRSFREDIGDYILKEQYNRQRFAVEVFPAVDQFPVNMGDMIALSGNSGSSGGPHLHFEIRDGNQRPVNPLKYNFQEVKDEIPPTVQRIALKTLDIDARINGRFGIFEFTPYVNSGQYRISDPIEVTGRVGVLVMAYDRLNGASNRNGVPHLRLDVDGKRIISINVDTFAFHQSREILTFRDHALKYNNNRSYQKLYTDDGNNLPFYLDARNEGKIHISENRQYGVRVVLQDAYLNTAEVGFALSGVANPRDTSIVTSRFEDKTFEVIDNSLKITMQNGADPDPVAEVYTNRIKYRIRPAYRVNDHSIFLWDLREGLPDSVGLGDVIQYPGIDMMVPSGTDFSYYQPYLDLHFTKRSLFDTVYLNTTYRNDSDAEREFFQIGDPAQPLRSHYTAVLKPRRPYNHRARIAAYSTDDLKSFTYEGGQWKGKQFEFRTRDYGQFTLLADTVPPTVRIIEQNSNNFRCYVEDDLSGIHHIELRIDRNWVLMHYDPKRRYCWSEKLDPAIPFKGKVELQVIDHVQNEKLYHAVIE